MKKSFKRGKIEKLDKKSKNIIQGPKGMHDILPIDQPWWSKIKKISQEIADFYNFSRIDTPIMEFSEVFEKSAGRATDIIEKQMYYVKNSGKDSLALRPEGTAGIVRAYFEHNLSRTSQPSKLFYFGPFFRHESPQAGRYRQFYQVGFEILGGENDPIYDAQVVLASYRLIEELKIRNLTVEINSLGCKSCRPAYCRKIQDYYKKFRNKICRDCQRRLFVSPLRLLDCKNEDCQKIKIKAPIMIDCLCSACRSHFRSVLEYLDELGISYSLNSYLVRGLDYYNRTVFEFLAEGCSVSLGGGGRYDDLAKIMEMKKDSLPAVGSGLGVDRLINAMKTQGIEGVPKNRAKIFLVQIGKPAKKRSLRLIEELREAGIKVFESLGKESLKSQLKVADKEGVTLALILGQKEVFEESVIVRNMKSGAQETVPLVKVVESIKKRLKQEKQ